MRGYVESLDLEKRRIAVDFLTTKEMTYFRDEIGLKDKLEQDERSVLLLTNLQIDHWEPKDSTSTN